MPPLQVLVVDDEPLILSAIARALRDRAEVTCAETAEKALAQCEDEIKRGEFDLVFLDLWMPGLPDGIDFYRKLQELGPRMPMVVFMTGDATAAGVVRERLHTVCIDKPFSREQLLSAMDRASARPPKRQSASFRRPV